ncbi:polysaccharide deacetylase family protein [Paenibacillus sp. ACRRX]|uniref:polysaccharide deacetylase family protein n=1 Tax=Paenibacillus sp. ACRRX TaxID=2918206 RepID=UPI001EF4DF8B|nr:polysaccharide deacetylase family protein [Paenibacillus sp. ACRRX]MCG7408885.1 polysaccharide deacetylase family protein [Paenibacillus sp. ACRRX]
MLTFILLVCLTLLCIYMLVPFVITRICGIGAAIKGKHQRNVALTFDDGPDPYYTPRLLDMLKEHGVKATFFVLGSRAELYPELIKRMHMEGHQIGIHNYSHKSNWIMTPFCVRRQHIERSAAIVEQITGERPAFYRPPWGLLNLGDLFLLRKSYQVVLWSVMGRDWKLQADVTRWKRYIAEQVQPGSIILLHDCGSTLGADEGAPGQMLTGLPYLLEDIRAKGLRCVRADEMLAKNNCSYSQLSTSINTRTKLLSGIERGAKTSWKYEEAANSASAYPVKTIR